MKYGIVIKRIEIYDFEVEADSEEEAIDIADAMNDRGDVEKYHDDSDTEIEVYDI